MPIIFRILVVVLILAVIDYYAFQAVRTVTVNLTSRLRTIIHWSFWLFDIALVVAILVMFFTSDRQGPPDGFSLLLGMTLLSLVPKLFIIPFVFGEDIYRTMHAAYVWISQRVSDSSASEAVLFESRRKFISQLALGVAAVPFVGIIYGMIKGKYDYKIHRVELKFKDLPDAFDGFTITQLSDIHSGSFDNADEVARGVQMANDQKSDLLVFTGDLVNNKAEEMEPWISTFSKLEAPYGKYSVFGNHDYGDYIPWSSEKAKTENLERLKEIHEETGFNLLLNKHVKIEKEGQSISLIGIENWGNRGFAKYGKLNEAVANVHRDDFKILLSHDPSHWEAETLKHDKHIHLTLAGHTHGMQFGVEIPGFRWSPVQYVYKQWGGAYESAEKYLYVNRGFGFIGFHGRVGISPEITVITLKKA